VRDSTHAELAGKNGAAVAEDLDAVIASVREALREFAKGNPGPLKALFSHGDDVTLANPFGPAVRGWQRASEALDYASSRFREGDVTSFETIASYTSPDLASLHEVERWQAKVGESDDIASWDLRVTSTYRRDGDTWKLVHRHADPIATADSRGPLRAG
jgi:ketosteroid isomerase-like protein